MSIGWPEGIYIALSFMSLGIAVARKNGGFPPTQIDIGTQIIAMIVAYSLLWWGGFFA